MNKNHSLYIESVLLVILILCTLSLRLASLNYIDGSDNYNDVAYKNLYQNGESCYTYSTITSALTMLLVKTFGFHLYLLKIPSILYSLITIFFIYLTARRIDKIPAAFSIVLFAISPWSIVLSRVTRDYAFDCMIGAIVLYLVDTVVSTQDKKDVKRRVYDIGLIILILAAIYILAFINHRNQTLIIAVFPAVAGLVLMIDFIKLKCKSNIAFVLWVLVFGFACATFLYFVEYENFQKGFALNSYAFKIFFDPRVKSPWQWFWGFNFPGFWIVWFIFYLIPIFYVLKFEKIYINNFLLYYASFFMGLFIFIFKFKSHLNYTPTRYLYFLFPIYAMTISFSFYYLIKLFANTQAKRILLTSFAAILFVSIFNIKALSYAIYPEKAFKRENIGTLQIDNIGIGRFDMDEVVNYIREELSWDNEKIFVFGGRYGEFILLLDYKMDNKKCLKRGAVGLYDTGKNMYVESSYFNYHELESAVKKNSGGYLVTQDKFITDESDNKVFELTDTDFNLYGTLFKFLKEINGYKIYNWTTADIATAQTD